MKLATIVVKVSETLAPGTYVVFGADGFMCINYETVYAGPGTVTVTVEDE